MPLSLFLAAPGRSGCFQAVRSLNVPAHSSACLLPSRAICTAAKWQAVKRTREYIGRRSLSHDAPPRIHQTTDSQSQQAQPVSDAFSGLGEPKEPNEKTTSSEYGYDDAASFYEHFGESQLSARQRRQLASPNAFLMSVANHHQPGLYFTAPKSKLDLSYNNVRALVETWGVAQDASTKKQKPVKSMPEYMGPEFTHPSVTSLQSILGSFINKVGGNAAVQGHVSYEFSVAEMLYLRSRGFSAEDVVKWASVVLTRNPDIAAEYFTSAGTSAPLFLLLFFLRRAHVSVGSLQVILTRVQNYHLKVISSMSRRDLNIMDTLSFSLILIRLVRHSRKVWPLAVPDIATLLTTQMERLRGIFPRPGAKMTSFSYFCNRFLTLLSLPTSIDPYISSKYQETAQFKVLVAMSEHEPPVPVTQEGYRALTRVQLSHRKTEQEQEWALLKSKAWPPWKENRTAMDEDKGVEDGISRAGLVMQQMYASGYPPDAWESNATIYAGWDTDRSPTIQTRTNLPNVPLRIRSVDSLRIRFVDVPSHVKQKFEIAQWAARVRATRTKREAWACFLAYEKTDLPAHQDVFQSMFMKLGLTFSSREATVFPGDGREVFPEPLSTHETVYVSEPVPSYEELVNRMIAKKVWISGRCLASLLGRAPEKQAAMALLNHLESGYGGAVGRLLRGSVTSKKDVQTLPDYLLVEILNLFCRARYIPGYLHRRTAKEFSDSPRNYSWEYVYQIVKTCQPDYKPAWRLLLRWINIDHAWPNYETASCKIYRWQLMCQILGNTAPVLSEPDDELLKIVCTRLYHTALCYYAVGPLSRKREKVFAGNSRYIRMLFHSLVTPSAQDKGEDPDQSKLEVLIMPSPYSIHAYIRALGIVRDFEGLYTLASWIAKFHPVLLQRADTQVKGRRKLRDALVGMRVFMERSWGALNGQGRHAPAPAELIELVREKIESVPDLGGWPTDEEVDAYFQPRSNRTKDRSSIMSQVF